MKANKHYDEYSRQIAFFSCNEFSVGLTRRFNRTTNSVTGYCLNLKVPGQTRRRRNFPPEQRDAASELFESIRVHGMSRWTGPEAIQDRMSDAQIVINEPSAATPFHRTLTLACAIDRVLSSSQNLDHWRHQDNLCDLLPEHNQIPKEPEQFDQWLREIIAIIAVTTRKAIPGGAKTPGRSTLRKRFDFLCRALERISAFPVVFGTEVSKRASTSAAFVKTMKKNATNKARPIRHHQALGLPEIELLIDNCSLLTEQLYIIKSLCSGLRPAEVERLNSSHIVNKKTILSRVVRKTEGCNKRPPTPIALRIILDLEEILGKPSKRFIEKGMGVNRYRLRTTLATHLAHCGLDFNTICEYTGHANATMVITTYATNKPPHASDNPVETYRVPKLYIDAPSGQHFFPPENLYHTWLLRKLLQVLFGELGRSRFATEGQDTCGKQKHLIQIRRQFQTEFPTREILQAFLLRYMQDEVTPENLVAEGF